MNKKSLYLEDIEKIFSGIKENLNLKIDQEMVARDRHPDNKLEDIKVSCIERNSIERIYFILKNSLEEE